MFYLFLMPNTVLQFYNFTILTTKTTESMLLNALLINSTFVIAVVIICIWLQFALAFTFTANVLFHFFVELDDYHNLYHYYYYFAYVLYLILYSILYTFYRLDSLLYSCKKLLLYFKIARIQLN